MSNSKPKPFAPVGSIVEIKDQQYRVVLDTPARCTGCAFERTACAFVPFTCYEKQETGMQSVIFVEVEEA